MPGVFFPPLRFTTVEPGVHRGAYPTLRNFPFLRRLRLRTVVSLIPVSNATPDLVDFCEAEGIVLVHHRTREPAKGEPVCRLSMSDRTIASILSILVDPSQHPVFVHCVDGIQATGVIISHLRKVWISY